MKTYQITMVVRSETTNETELEQEIDNIIRKAEDTTIATVIEIQAIELIK